MAYASVNVRGWSIGGQNPNLRTGVIHGGRSLRTQLLRILDNASITVWPRPFHNLRASRETELANEFPIHVVCEWIGNSEEVARKHYLQVTEAHFQKATSNPTSHVRADGGKRRQTEKETAVSPAIAKNTAVLVPPRGVEPRFSG